MSYTHRGLSDVVTTVLIILLVVVAVVAIGAYVRTSVDQTGKTVERESTCLINHVDPTTCRYINATVGANLLYNVSINTKRTSDDASVASLGTISAATKLDDGTLQTSTVIGGSPASNAGSATGAYNVTGVKKPVEVTITTEFILKNGNKVTCPSSPVSCTA